ncbi:MAG TPA: FAD-dependent oxidoreductase, partial [Povalibacter sp.]
DTARTTAHLTYVTDERFHRLVEKFGKDAAAEFWHGGSYAIDTIERICEEAHADAQFVRIPGYLHAPIGDSKGEQLQSLRKDAELAAECGFEAEFIDAVPHALQPGVRFANQARFHPLRYLQALLPVIQKNGGLIFEDTAFENMADDGASVHANGHVIRCQYLVIATHNPLMGKKGPLTSALFQTKLSLYTSYVLGARLPLDSAVPDALFWDTNDPYEYLRLYPMPDHQYAIFGGKDVKTGQERDTAAVFERLTTRLREVLPAASVEHRWMGQVVETDDGMPFIGENEEREFIATGFCGNGFTLGTLAASMACDRFLGRPNPWLTLFETRRSPFHGGTWRYLKENVDYPYYFVRDRLRRAVSELEEIPRGEGRIVSYEGRKMGAYRDHSGRLSLLASECTHLKCLVHWNSADSTWDCPCHGSRFRPTGEVLSGPAEKPLERQL